MRPRTLYQRKKSANSERSLRAAASLASSDSRERQIAAITAQIQALDKRLTQASEETRAAEVRHNAAVCALSEKELELAKVTNALDECSALADSQKDEIALLTIQVRTLQEELNQAREGTKAAISTRCAAWACLPIGGAGTFDGIFLTGILAALLASLYTPRPAH